LPNPITKNITLPLNFNIAITLIKEEIYQFLVVT